MPFSIIVNEYADRKMNIGHTPMQAYKEAATRVFWPVVSSTVTTLVVFMPQKLSFIDQVKVFLKAGKGGDGSLSFRSKRNHIRR